MAAGNNEVVGFIKHDLSSMIINPAGGGVPPVRDDTVLLICKDELGEGLERLEFKFYPVQGEGRYGYVEHVLSGKVVHPHGGTPKNDVALVLHSGRDSGCLWMFDYEKDTFVSKSGLSWDSKSGASFPEDSTGVVLNNGHNIGAKFHMVDHKGARIDPYPKPTLSGRWKLVLGVINPKVTSTYSRTYNVGRSATDSTRKETSVDVTAGIAVGWFSANAKFSTLVERTSSSTWNESTEMKYDVTIPAGPTIAHWQWIFNAEQLGTSLSFGSPIFQDTNDITRPPPSLATT